MPKPKLGQHFLQDLNYVKTILRVSQVSESDAVIEVGPGKGVLTRALLGKAGKVVALELDSRLAAGIKEKFAERNNLEVHLEDARRVNWTEWGARLRAQGFGRVKLVSNLPYYLATQMVIHALAAPQACDRLVVMVQAEVARRMCAQPGTKEYSSYSVAVQYYGLPKYIVTVPARAFRPAPRVSSGVVLIDRREKPAVSVPDPDRFFFLVHSMFTHRRKTIRNCLQGLDLRPGQEIWDAALEKAGLDPKRRPETLSLEELAALANVLHAPA